MKVCLNLKLTVLYSIIFITTFTFTLFTIHFISDYFSKVSENKIFSYSYTNSQSSYSTLEKPSSARILQGDPIIINPNENSQEDKVNICTVGYIDKHNRVLYTAGHCFNGIKDPSHTKVYNKEMQPIGYLDENNGKNLRKHDPNGTAAILGNDWGKIHLYKNVFAENPISGDKMLNANKDAKIGEDLCYFSRKNGKVSCSHIMKIKDNVIVSGTKENNTMNGDSGGPAWIPYRGFVGVISISTESRYDNKDNNNKDQAIGINTVESPYIDHKANIDTHKTMKSYKLRKNIRHLLFGRF